MYELIGQANKIKKVLNPGEKAGLDSTRKLKI